MCGTTLSAVRWLLSRAQSGVRDAARLLICIWSFALLGEVLKERTSHATITAEHWSMVCQARPLHNSLVMPVWRYARVKDVLRQPVLGSKLPQLQSYSTR